jgi:cell division protease FtsH
MTREELVRKMSVLLGGRAAELLIFDHLSTGAADDLSRATEIARSMVTRYAMVPALGNVAYDEEASSFLGATGMPGPRRYSEQTAREIDCAVREIVEGAFQSARSIVEGNRGILEEGARRLLDKETLEQSELEALFAKVAPVAEGSRNARAA